VLIQTNGNPIKIDALKSVQRRGAYAPFTTSGNIVVSDIMVSNYVSLMPEKETGLPVSMQWIAHTFNAPHRMICSLSFAFCENEAYTNGISNWVVGGLRAGQWLAQKNSLVKVIGSSVFFTSFLVLAGIELVAPFLSTIMVLGVGLVLLRNNRSQSLLK